MTFAFGGQKALGICIFTPNSFIRMLLLINGPLVVRAVLIIQYSCHSCIDDQLYVLHVLYYLTRSIWWMLFAAIAELLDNAVDEVKFCS